jgi:hypothetical protein
MALALYLFQSANASLSGPALSILWLIGIGLIVLGGVAGVVLLIKATTAKGKDEVSGKSTLWGLFVVGLGGGLILVMTLAQIR